MINIKHKYLKITLHDNDFGEELYFLGFYLRKYLRYNSEYLDNVDIDKLKLFCLDFLKLHYSHFCSHDESEDLIDLTYIFFSKKLEVEFLSDVNIINNDGEDLYISLSKSKDYGYFWIQ